MDYTKREDDRIEIWKDKKDYEGLYQASNLGRVRSVDRWVKGKSGSLRLIKGKILKPGTTKDGYLQVVLCKNGKEKTFRVHRLVAETFLLNPENLPEVNHKDEDKTNNNVENLEFCDRTYNVNYGTRNEKQSKKVYQYTLDGQFVREWVSTREAGRNGFNSGHIASCCKGKQKTHKDFIWKYK